MPFRQRIKIISKNLCALQAQYNPRNKWNHRFQSLKSEPGGRVFFFISRRKGVSGSITVEAAMLATLFLLFTIFLFSLFEFMYLENRLQAVMEKWGEKAAMFGAVKEALGEEFSAGEVYSVLGDLLFSGAGGEYLEGQIKEELKDLLPGNFCKGENLRLNHFLLYKEEGIVDLVLTYEIGFPVAGSYERVLRCRKRIWTGEGGEEKAEGSAVYITVTGSVYHLYADCSHLKLSVRKMSRNSLALARNQAGGKYSACELCAEGDTVSETVYVTSEGSRFHNSSSCSGLKRGVLSVALSQVKDRPLCERCGEREGNP